MSNKRPHELYRVYSLGSFFICIFLFVGTIGSYWYFHRRTNSYNHERENGVDIMAPTYQTPEGEQLDKEFRASRMKAPEAKAETAPAAENKTEKGSEK